MEIPSWIARILAAWAGIGSLLISGLIPSPSWLLPFFEQGLIDGTRVFIGSFITFLAVLKAAKIIRTDSVLKSRTTGSQYLYALNPFAA